MSESRSVFPYDLRCKVQLQLARIDEEVDAASLAGVHLAIKQLQADLATVGIANAEDIKERYVTARQRDSSFTQHDFTTALRIAKHMAVLQAEREVSVATYEAAEALWLRLRPNCVN